MEDFLRQGIIQANRGDYQTAISLFSQAIAFVQSAEAYYRRGLAYYSSGQIERAIADYDRSLSLDPQVDLYLSRAIALNRKDIS